jgi:hypothetical protein
VRARRRRLVVGVVLVAVAFAAIGSGAASVVPRRPGSLAAGPNGVLYVADTVRHQVLTRLPDGSFRVVAGTGRPGRSGDGGRAVDAELDTPYGMAVGRDGTLYVADAGSDRVRAVAPDGTIRTVAEIRSPTAVAIGRGGALYVAAAGANEVVRVRPSGALTRVAGTGNAGPAGIAGIGGPATRASADGPSGLAFDRAGDLFIAGFNTKTLLMVTPKGTMTLPDGRDGFYPRGEGGLLATRHGVLAIDGQRIVRLTPHGIRTLVDFSGRRLGGVTGFEPNGIADAGGGSLYVDTYEGNGFANASALVEVEPGGRIRLLWRSG